MRPLALNGHTRPLTQLKYNNDGDLLFSTARDQVPSVWFSHNGERLGTLTGHVGAVFSIDVDPTSTVVATGAADQSARLWLIQTGQTLHTWNTKATARRVEFSPDGKLLLVVTEEHMGHRGTIWVFPLNTQDITQPPESSEPTLVITNPPNGSKFTVASWGYGGNTILAGHADGSVSRFDAITGESLQNVQVHENGTLLMDLQMSADRSYFVTAGKDRTAHLVLVDNLEVVKTYVADTPINSASITPVKNFVILGGGQDARDVTTTSARDGKFEARFYHKLFEDEIGSVKGHFGPLNTVAIHPKGLGYASGGEDGYIRIHHFEKSYFDFVYDVERR